MDRTLTCYNYYDDISVAVSMPGGPLSSCDHTRDLHWIPPVQKQIERRQRAQEYSSTSLAFPLHQKSNSTEVTVAALKIIVTRTKILLDGILHSSVFLNVRRKPWYAFVYLYMSGSKIDCRWCCKAKRQGSSLKAIFMPGSLRWECFFWNINIWSY